MSLENFLEQLNKTPDSIEFDDVIAIIDANYTYTPTAFRNGDQENTTGQNEGSCKILAFGQVNNLDKEKTLNCFGKYYREDVLNDPDGDNHQNIRQFMQHGWSGINFPNPALKKKHSKK